MPGRLNMADRRFSLLARLGSFRFATRGIRSMLLSQHNAWIHATFTIAVVIAGFTFRLERLEWCAVVIAMMAVWTAEALNTALEFLCDVASPEFHPLVEKSKDVAAGSVLLATVGAVIVGILIFWPHLMAML